MTLFEDAVQKLKKNHYSVTKERQAVIRAMTAHLYECLTIHEIYVYSADLLPSISVPTVYRGVSLFCALHILRRLQFNMQHSYYELIGSEENENHPYCICRHCGRILGIFDPRVLEIFSVCKQKIDDSYNFRIESTNLIYYGLCKTCEQQEKHKINSKGGESM